MPAVDPDRRRGVAAIVLCVALALAGCSGSDPQSDATTAAGSDSTPVVGPEEQEVRLDEGAATIIADEDTSRTVEVLGFEQEDDPVVVMEVRPESAEADTYRLTLGDTLTLGADVWRISEIAVSDAEAYPGSVTLQRNPE